VAAAVIAWRRARESGDDLPGRVGGPGRVGYRLGRSAEGLTLQRVIVGQDGTYPLEATLAAVASGRVQGPTFVAAQADLAAELALGTHRRGPLPRQLIPKLFARLSHCSDVRLDDRPVAISVEPVLPRARLVDRGAGFLLTVEEDPSVSELFPNGVARCRDTLRPVGETRLSGRELHELPRGRYFGPDDLAELVTSILPSLRRRITLEICTDRLPRTADEPPRISIRSERSGETLSVLAGLVYGDPPRARVDGGRLVHLEGDVPVRDEAAEKRWVRRLRRELQLVPGVRADFTGEEAVAFASRLEAWKEAVEGDAHRYFRLAPPLQPSLRIEDDRLELDFDSLAADAISGGARHGRAEASSVLHAWREGRSLVPLTEGGWAPLPRDWLERHGHRVADLLAAREPDGTLPRCILPDLARLCEEMDRPPPPHLEGLRSQLGEFEGIPPAALPGDLVGQLRDYQTKGVDWLVFLRGARLGALLADDMGLGKTLQALCALAGRSLVVAPTSVLHNWAEEIRRFRPGLDYCVYHGPSRSLDAAAAVTLTTYAILRLDADRLAAEQWDTVVLDEAQAIKNPESQVARAAFRLQAAHRLALTGTPVENRLDELWSQFHFVNRGLLGGRRNFQERYAGPIADGEAGAAERLRERIRPFILRRLKQEVAPELPPRTEMVLRCELSPAERETYDAIRVATLDEVVKRLQSGGGVLAALEALLRLRQAACHSGLVPGQQADRSAKLDLLLESLDSVVAEGHKALVFSQWTSLLDLTEPHLAAANIDFVRLDGSTRDRAGVVHRFQDEAGPPVMLISLKAGGTGLNLTAADHIFLLDPWWNPAVEDQAADRAHRIGQDRPVMVYRLVAEETVEERILLLQQRKREIAEAALGGADRATGITRQELLELLG
jgi:superfamily II DNA or RNA helicase